MSAYTSYLPLNIANLGALIGSAITEQSYHMACLGLSDRFYKLDYNHSHCEVMITPSYNMKGRQLLVLPFRTNPLHFAYLSRFKAGEIAFIKDLKDLSKRLHTTMKVGRYLKKYHPELSDDEIRLLSNDIQSADSDRFTFELHKDEIEYIYQESYSDSDGCESCMSKEPGEYSSSIHPMSIFNDHPSMGVVVIRDKHKSSSEDNPLGGIVARALVDHHRMIFPMVYGRWELIAKMLEDNGYKHKSLDGLFIDITRDDYNDSIVLPYIDGIRDLSRSSNSSQEFNIVGDQIHLCEGGEHNAGETDGLYPSRESIGSCDNCGDMVYDGDDYTYTDDEYHVCDNCDHSLTSAIDSNGYHVQLYHDSETVVTEDSKVFVDSYAAECNDYVMTASEEWHPVDETICCDEGECWLISELKDLPYIKGGASLKVFECNSCITDFINRFESMTDLLEFLENYDEGNHDKIIEMAKEQFEVSA